MIKIEFLGPINKPSISLEASTLNEIKQELQKDKELFEWLKKSAVAVNDKIILDTNLELKDGDKISILPPVCGG
jgi:molybdopterin synthase sulfur carrier subunit